MTTYSRISDAPYGLKHNAARAAKKIPGAVVFPDGDAWRWGVPADPGEITAEANAVDEAELGGLTEAEYGAEQDLAEAVLSAEAMEEEDNRPRHEQLSVDEALVYGGDYLAAPAAAASVLALAAEMPVPAEPATEALVQAARDQAGLMERNSPEVAWLLRSMADRLACGAAVPRLARERRPAEPRQPRVQRDWTVRPVITSQANQHVQKLIDRIHAQRGNAKALRALNTFSRASTYYAVAGKHLDALLAEAEAGKV